ncbi:hypothetical protein H4R35_005352 [Dimargaris xerosporica]|nr:hypothetical protein H4R35_005352 [Dimargaris xerosporica]
MNYLLTISLLAVVDISRVNALPMKDNLVPYNSNGNFYKPEKVSILPIHLSEAVNEDDFRWLKDTPQSRLLAGAKPDIGIGDFEEVDANAGVALADID